MKPSWKIIYPLTTTSTYSLRRGRSPPRCVPCGCDRPGCHRTFVWRRWVPPVSRWDWSGSALCTGSWAAADRWASRTESWRGHRGRSGPSSWQSGWTPCEGRGPGGRLLLHLEEVRRRWMLEEDRMTWQYLQMVIQSLDWLPIRIQCFWSLTHNRDYSFWTIHFHNKWTWMSGKG